MYRAKLYEEYTVNKACIWLHQLHQGGFLDQEYVQSEKRLQMNLSTKEK